MRFSSRYTASKGKQTLILEDAPRPTRIEFLKGVLAEFVGTHRRSFGQAEPLDILETHQAFVALIRDEADPWDYDNESAWGALTAHLKDCTWLEFYDFVELVGTLLIKKEDDDPFSGTEYYKKYQAKVNALLQEDGIGWSLNDKSELRRQIPQALAKRVKATESDLSDNMPTPASTIRRQSPISISIRSTRPIASRKS